MERSDGVDRPHAISRQRAIKSTGDRSSNSADLRIDGRSSDKRPLRLETREERSCLLPSEATGWPGKEREVVAKKCRGGRFVATDNLLENTVRSTSRFELFRDSVESVVERIHHE